MTEAVLTNYLWYAPFNAREPQPLQSVFDEPAPDKAIVTAQAFTVSLDTTMVGKRPAADLLSAILSRRRDVLITSSAFLGSKPTTRRVHYYEHSIPQDEPLKEFLASTMFVCDDYSGKDRLWLDVRVVEVTTSDQRDDAIKAFQSLAQSSGAVFPITLPYTAVASALASTIDRVVDAVESEPVMLFSKPIVLFPPGSLNQAQLQLGRYVAFPADVDGSDYLLATNGLLTTTDGNPVEDPHVVIRIDSGQEISPEVLVSQRVATLLTQLEHGSENNPTSTSFEFLKQTLSSYTDWKDLKRYAELKAKKDDELTQAERELMNRIASREDLRPLLPK
jgi:hypothetical protein